jgi:hypothetical protein
VRLTITKLTLFECPLYTNEPTCNVEMKVEGLILCDVDPECGTEVVGEQVVL